MTSGGTGLLQYQDTFAARTYKKYSRLKVSTECDANSDKDGTHRNTNMRGFLEIASLKMRGTS